MQPDDIDPSLVDFGVLARWMDGEGLPGGAFERVERLGGGTQNVLVRFCRGDRPYVLRRPPVHPRPRSNDALRREARVLAALDGTGVRAPRLIAACTDETVMNGVVFYLMESVRGFNPTTTLPRPYAEDPAVRHRMGLDAAAALAELGAVDHVAVGLGDVGHPEGFLERQVGRWLSELESYNALDGYPGADIPGLTEVAAWLEERRPRAWRPGIMHGDYHLANLLYDPDHPRVAAIVDWEMCTIGDPLLDLGWLIATWPAGEAAPLAGAIGTAGGLPATDELVDVYAARTDRDLSALTWYAVLACFKLGIVLEGTHARAFAGKASKDVGDLLHATTLGLFARARTFMET
ncbi:phosphotransferase family protein [Actinoallomurus iriomotensis]|uniref:Aminoglycoside phosphotransferase n=1 Tax=Actinoallomurus iriomotensis TaxID=478107 RepID=A0A9W6REN0_9ACTN|nr:phosphotransferase family protein [Actinoallomurus iriomotensis]GLY74189.1 putative aminoglycoside phosphotransferase [Actinoallomurus iriomotensis]